MTNIEDNLLRYEQFPNVCQALKNKTKRCCSKNGLYDFFPVLKWLPKYKKYYLLNDFVAGLTVGLTTIPQAIAYGAVANLQAQYGLYSAFMGCFVYIIFGTCKDITVGPTAIMALMIQIHVSGTADYAVLMCFLAGCIILLMGLLNLGVLVQFISIPVVTGFTMAAAITIASGQINNLFGIDSSSNEFLKSWINFFTHLTGTTRNDAILGISTLIILLLMRKFKDITYFPKTLSNYISLSRNALAVAIGILLCYFLTEDNVLPFKVGKEIKSGLPPFSLPPFSTNNNDTIVSFGEMISELGTSLVSIPLISVLESIAIAKAFSKGKIIDASQEMVALGFCNIFASFFSSMPITGSFTRSAINNASGVKTPLGGIVTGTLVLMCLAFLTQTFYYIPKATLAAIIIAAMIFMVDYRKIIEIWRSKKLDCIPFVITVICCLFWSLEYGIVCGILVNIIMNLYHNARPRFTITNEKINEHEIVMVEVLESISYCSAEYLKSKIFNFAINNKTMFENSFVVINGKAIYTIDSTVALNILTLQEDLKLINCELICWNWTQSAASTICRINHNAKNMFTSNNINNIFPQKEKNKYVEDQTTIS